MCVITISVLCIKDSPMAENTLKIQSVYSYLFLPLVLLFVVLFFPPFWYINQAIKKKQVSQKKIYFYCTGRWPTLAAGAYNFIWEKSVIQIFHAVDKIPLSYCVIFGETKLSFLWGQCLFVEISVTNNSLFQIYPGLTQMTQTNIVPVNFQQ